MAEECFAAGLLHDLGKVILLGERRKEYCEILERGETATGAIEEIEIAILGCSHAQLGAYLMSVWGLPTSLVQAVAFHHRPSEAIETVFSPLTAVHCADVFVRGVGSMAADALPLDREYLARLRVSERESIWGALAESSLFVSHEGLL